ncbi:MAG: hypothetical protein ACJ796_04935 [Gemmatimonadaceae bacterium]
MTSPGQLQRIPSLLMVARLLACVLTRSQAAIAQAPPTVRPGTYALRLCRVTCDAHYPKNTIRSGWIVLDSVPLDMSPFPDSVRRGLELHYLMQVERGPANGCFVLHSKRMDVRTYAGTAGLLHWERGRGDSVTFQLYQSPDAGHEVQVAPTTTGFAGTGHSWGAGVASVDYPEDLVIGDYLGPPKAARRCEDAGYDFLAEMRVAAATADSMFRGPPCDSARAMRVALDSVNKLNAFRSQILRFEQTGGWTRIVTRPRDSRRQYGTVIGLDGRCRIRSLAP